VLINWAAVCKAACFLIVRTCASGPYVQYVSTGNTREGFAQTSSVLAPTMRFAKHRLQSLGASSPLCYKYRKGVGTSKRKYLVSYLLCWRYVSATVGHLQVTKMYIEENYTECDRMHLYYGHNLYSFPVYTFLWPDDGPQWPKHVVSVTDRIQDGSVLTYPPPFLTQAANLRYH